jgi:hypothetical protein
MKRKRQCWVRSGNILGRLEYNSFLALHCIAFYRCNVMTDFYGKWLRKRRIEYHHHHSILPWYPWPSPSQVLTQEEDPVSTQKDCKVEALEEEVVYWFGFFLFFFTLLNSKSNHDKKPRFLILYQTGNAMEVFGYIYRLWVVSVSRRRWILMYPRITESVCNTTGCYATRLASSKLTYLN